MARTYKTVTAQALHFLLRAHTSVPQGPVTSPAAWRGDELRRSERWIDRLDGSDVAEIEAALAHARRTGKPLGELVADDFPLPSLGARVARWRATVADGLGVQVVKGVPVERWSTADCERFFWCFGKHLGSVDIARTPGVHLAMDFEPGDIQLLSNHTVLHSRGDYVDFEEDRKRHLLRLWLSFARPRWLRALPALGREAVRLVAALGAGRIRKRLHA